MLHIELEECLESLCQCSSIRTRQKLQPPPQKKKKKTPTKLSETFLMHMSLGNKGVLYCTVKNDKKAKDLAERGKQI